TSPALRVTAKTARRLWIYQGRRPVFGCLAPAGAVFAQDAERGLADQLVHQAAVRGMEAAAAHVAVQPLQLIPLEHAGPAGHVHGDIDDLLGALHAVMLG